MALKTKELFAPLTLLIASLVLKFLPDAMYVLGITIPSVIGNLSKYAIVGIVVSGVWLVINKLS